MSIDHFRSFAIEDTANGSERYTLSCEIRTNALIDIKMVSVCQAHLGLIGLYSFLFGMPLNSAGKIFIPSIIEILNDNDIFWSGIATPISTLETIPEKGTRW